MHFSPVQALQPAFIITGHGITMHATSMLNVWCDVPIRAICPSRLFPRDARHSLQRAVMLFLSGHVGPRSSRIGCKFFCPLAGVGVGYDSMVIVDGPGCIGCTFLVPSTDHYEPLLVSAAPVMSIPMATSPCEAMPIIHADQAPPLPSHCSGCGFWCRNLPASCRSWGSFWTMTALRPALRMQRPFSSCGAADM